MGTDVNPAWRANQCDEVGLPIDEDKVGYGVGLVLIRWSFPTRAGSMIEVLPKPRLHNLVLGQEALDE